MNRRKFLGLVSTLPLMGWLGQAQAKYDPVAGYKQHGYIPVAIGDESLSHEPGHILWTSFVQPKFESSVEVAWVKYRITLTPDFFNRIVSEILAWQHSWCRIKTEIPLLPGGFQITDVELTSHHILKTSGWDYDECGRITNNIEPDDVYAKTHWEMTLCGQTPFLGRITTHITDDQFLNRNGYTMDGCCWGNSPFVQIEKRRNNRIDYAIRRLL